MKETKYGRRTFLQKYLKLVYLLAGSGTLLSLRSNAAKKQQAKKIVAQDDLENPCDDL
jgi:hypothetical protein